MSAEDIGTFIGGVIIILIAAMAIGLLFAWPTMLLWNALMPDLFGLPALTFWQTFGLKVLLFLLIPTGSSVNTK